MFDLGHAWHGLGPYVAAPSTNDLWTTAMLKPSMLSLALIIALCSCSQSDDVATSDSPTPPDNTVQLGQAPTENDDTDDTAPIPASEPEQPAEKAAAQSEPKGDEKQTPNAAHDGAKRTRSRTERRWDEFQSAMERCGAVSLSAREQCLAQARDAYRSADFDCAALPPRARQECRQYAKLWEDADADVPTAAVTHDEEPAAIPAAPDDPRPAERNRDSTKQQQDAVGSLPEPTGPN